MIELGMRSQIRLTNVFSTGHVHGGCKPRAQFRRQRGLSQAVCRVSNRLVDPKSYESRRIRLGLGR